MRWAAAGVSRGIAASTCLVTLALMSGCRDTTAPVVGAITVTVFTEGAIIDLDLDGYTLSSDGGPAQSVGLNASVMIPDLPAGKHLVRLDGLAPNCSVTGANPRPVDVRSAAPVQVKFYVSCVVKAGTVRVSVSTSGPDPDLDGYLVAVGGLYRGFLPANGTLIVPGIREGQHEVTLDGVAGNCLVDAPYPKIVSVAFGVTVDVTFTIRCAAPARLRVTTATTGVDLDGDGYYVQLRDENDRYTDASVPSDGTRTISGLLPGNHVMTVSNLASNCDAVTPNPRVVTLAAGVETSVAIDITCEAARQIAFVEGFGTSADIYVIKSNGSEAVPLTYSPGADIDPAWSPDGSRIAFASERDGNFEIYVMNANGTSPVRLTNVTASDSRPAWSPDGGRIAFVSERDGNAEIYVMNADGTNPVRLTSDNAADADPAWSPDGRRIAFGSIRGGNSAIWVMNADGSSPARLTSNDRGDWHPSWSPDGNRIAFSRGLSSNIREIFVINADGSSPTQLTWWFEEAVHPAWSPDGRKIAFGTISFYYGSDIQVISTEGISYSPVTNSRYASNPAWRP